jgi:hypothetical protein
MGSRSFWLIVKQRCSGLEVSTIGSNVLPVFSFREEAEMFLRLGEFSDRWSVRESTCGELVSLLYGPCRRVRHVALDPLPELFELVSMSREAFVEALLAGDPVPPVVEMVGAAS